MMKKWACGHTNPGICSDCGERKLAETEDAFVEKADVGEQYIKELERRLETAHAKNCECRADSSRHSTDPGCLALRKGVPDA